MKIPVLESLFNKIADLKTCSFAKKRLQHRCFPVKFAKFLRTPFFNRAPPVAASEQTEEISVVHCVAKKCFDRMSC